MRELVFIDASAWIALYDADDGNHTVAVSKQQRIREEAALIYTRWNKERYEGRAYMGQIKSHSPVKLIVGIITAIPDQLPSVHRRLSERFGRIDFISALLPFDYTNYYEAEMGKALQRQFVSLETLIAPDELASAKHFLNAAEQEFAAGDTAPRPINLDPGYISAAKLVLASTKDHAHRIYLQQGIYAEITLRFHRKTFQPWEWTYPDYRTPAYIDIFNHIRCIYMEQLKAEGLTAHPL